jgi:hypothetical protein
VKVEPRRDVGVPSVGFSPETKVVLNAADYRYWLRRVRRTAQSASQSAQVDVDLCSLRLCEMQASRLVKIA